MRLLERGKVGDGNPQSEVFDKFAEKHEVSKRGRAGVSGSSRTSTVKKESSSLDFKPPTSAPAKSLTRPPVMKPPKKLTQEQISAEQQQKQRLERQVKTRARGASGLPPRKLSLDELSRLDHDDFIKALYEDPDLARAFAEEHAKSEKTKNGGPKMKRSMKRDAKYSRTPDGSVEKRSEFLEELKKGGVPVVQWAVIIVILVAVVYQFYKLLAGPQAAPLKKQVRTPAKKKLPKQPKSKKQTGSVVAEDPAENEVVAEVEKAVADPAANEKKKKVVANKRVPPKKVNSSAKQKAAPAASSVKQKQESKPEPKPEPKPLPKENGAKNSHTRSPDPLSSFVEKVDASEDTGEWKTVARRPEPSSKPVVEREVELKPKSENGAKKEVIAINSVAKEKTAPSPNPQAPEAVESRPEPSKVSEPEIQKEIEVPKVEPTNKDDSKENSPQENNPSTKKNKNKKKSKKSAKESGAPADEMTNDTTQEKKDLPEVPKKGSTASSDPKEEPQATAPDLATTNNDAELALKLQAEEEVLALKAAEAAAAKPKEDVWEEVTVRRRRPNKSGQEDVTAAA